MTKKDTAKRKVSKKTIKTADPVPKQLTPNEARCIETYGLKKECHDLSNKVAELELQVSDRDKQLAEYRHRIKLLEANFKKQQLQERHKADRVRYNELVEELKTKFGVERLAYDPDSPEILEG